MIRPGSNLSPLSVSAQEVLLSLLKLLLDHTRPPLVLSRTAGDAVISYALEESGAQGQTFVELI